MIKKIASKRKIIVIAVVALILMILFTGIYPLAKQEDNFISILKGIYRLNIYDCKIVEYDNSCEYVEYISETKDGEEPLIALLESEGWVFEDQMGSGYIFKKDDVKITIQGTQFSRYFRIWKIPQ